MGHRESSGRKSLLRNRPAQQIEGMGEDRILILISGRKGAHRHRRAYFREVIRKMVRMLDVRVIAKS